MKKIICGLMAISIALSPISSVAVQANEVYNKTHVVSKHEEEPVVVNKMSLAIGSLIVGAIIGKIVPDTIDFIKDKVKESLSKS